MDEQTPPVSRSLKLSHSRLGERDIYLLGTAHVSAASVQDVRDAMEQIDPDTVCVELCASRHEAMMDTDRWKKMDIWKVLRGGKAAFLLGQLLLTSFYQRLAEKLGVEPGAEMREALVLGEQRGAHLVLADRAVEVTLKRTWRLLGWRQKFSVMSQLMSGLVSGEEIEQEDIDQLRQEGEIEGAIEAFASMLPSVKRHLIDERDVYLAQKIRDAGGQRILAVVGAGHVAGITQALEVEHDLEEFEHVPPVSGWFKVLKASLPLLIVALPFWFFAGSKSEVPIQSLWVWGGSHAILAAVGSALALAHPLAILATALAAPFTSLNPLLAAGWVGGMVQLFMHKPTVADLESLPSAITSFKGFWKHPVTKILLVVALGNLGSSLGTLLSGAWIVTQFLS